MSKEETDSDLLFDISSQSKTKLNLASGYENLKKGSDNSLDSVLFEIYMLSFNQSLDRTY